MGNTIKVTWTEIAAREIRGKPDRIFGCNTMQCLEDFEATKQVTT